MNVQAVFFLLTHKAFHERGMDIDGRYGIPLMTAARNISDYAAEVGDIMSLMRVPSVGTEIAEMIVTEIIGRAFTVEEDADAFLEGARAKCQQR